MDPIQALTTAVTSMAAVVIGIAALFRWWLPRQNSHNPGNPGTGEMGKLLEEVKQMREADMKHHEREEAFWGEFLRALTRLEGKF